MIFKQWEQVLGGTKTQTRRPVKEGEQCLDGDTVARQWLHEHIGYITGHRVWTPYEIKWQRGRTYAVQPGRGKKSVGRIRITKIRRERLAWISEAACLAEGVRHEPADFEGIGVNIASPTMAIKGRYGELWDSIYGPRAWERMKDDDVWVLEFEVANSG